MPGGGGGEVVLVVGSGGDLLPPSSSCFFSRDASLFIVDLNFGCLTGADHGWLPSHCM